MEGAAARPLRAWAPNATRGRRWTTTWTASPDRVAARAAAVGQGDRARRWARALPTRVGDPVPRPYRTAVRVHRRAAPCRSLHPWSRAGRARRHRPASVAVVVAVRVADAPRWTRQDRAPASGRRRRRVRADPLDRMPRREHADRSAPKAPRAGRARLTVPVWRRVRACRPARGYPADRDDRPAPERAADPAAWAPDQAFQDQAFQDQAFQDQVLQDRAFQDRAFLDRGFQDQAFQLQDGAFQDRASQDPVRKDREPAAPRCRVDPMARACLAGRVFRAGRGCRAADRARAGPVGAWRRRVKGSRTVRACLTVPVCRLVPVCLRAGCGHRTPGRRTACVPVGVVDPSTGWAAWTDLAGRQVRAVRRRAAQDRVARAWRASPSPDPYAVLADAGQADQRAPAPDRTTTAQAAPDRTADPEAEPRTAADPAASGQMDAVQAAWARMAADPAAPDWTDADPAARARPDADPAPWDRMGAVPAAPDRMGADPVASARPGAVQVAAWARMGADLAAPDQTDVDPAASDRMDAVQAA
ncbi:hypothetical protein Psuf_063540 [Phytohabitans suffuscus]|uniref:Uncharacterized protein n=1 Tax=Phytohabitans suffuscus TaxID=624315 RepID=A0A6F8YT82_9ACTN|nr:hypothetical protein Psuf_063540 [Phytohabitans suffuscus]